MALCGGRKGVTTTLPPECNADTKTLDFRSLVIGFHSFGPGHWVPVQSSLVPRPFINGLATYPSSNC